MSTAELKNNLHRLIVETDNTDILLKVQNILIEPKSEVFELSDYEIQQIEKGLKDIEEGRVYTHKEVRAKIDKWIAEKQL